jgi:hypothetical protein
LRFPVQLCNLWIIGEHAHDSSPGVSVGLVSNHLQKLGVLRLQRRHALLKFRGTHDRSSKPFILVMLWNNAQA